jgi:hypothetical protein
MHGGSTVAKVKKDGSCCEKAIDQHSIDDPFLSFALDPTTFTILGFLLSRTREGLAYINIDVQTEEPSWRVCE